MNAIGTADAAKKKNKNHEKVSILGNIITILAISFGERMQNKE